MNVAGRAIGSNAIAQVSETSDCALSTSRNYVTPSIALMVATDGRAAYITQAIETAQQYLKGEFSRFIIINDAGDPGYSAFLDATFPTFEIVHHPERYGMSRATRSFFEEAHATGCDYIFRLEEDFVFHKTVNVKKMARLLHCEQHLSQLVR